MPTDLNEVQTGGTDLLFADDLDGTEFKLSEIGVYDAEEVQEALDSDTPEFGRWLRISTAQDDGAFAVAPGELLEELQDLEAEPGESFVVTRCEKAGTAETDPYEVNVERLSDGSQNRLNG